MTVADALRKWGVTVVEVSGWQTRGWLKGFGGTWDPHGVVCHHTANAGFRGVDAPSLNVCINGRPDLAGPLCQIVLGYSGTAFLIAGRGANHAGKGGWNGLSGNAAVWGIEAENTGLGEPWPPEQLDAFVRCCAALAEFSGFGPEMVCGHKEWTPQKIDPAGIDMNDFRARVAALLNGAAIPQLSEEDDMAGEWVLMWHEGENRQYAVLAQGGVNVGKHHLALAAQVEVFNGGFNGPVGNLGNQGRLLDSLPWVGAAPAWADQTEEQILAELKQLPAATIDKLVARLRA